MIFRIGFELILALAICFVGSMSWQLQKRGKFLRAVIRDPKSLQSFISLNNLSNPPTRVAFFAQKNEIGYFYNIGVTIDADQKSQRVPKIISSLLLAFLLACSYFIGWPFLAANVILFFLLSFAGLSESARSNALEQVLTLAVIFHIWHRENPAECEEWVLHATTLRPLYETVKAVQSESVAGATKESEG